MKSWLFYPKAQKMYYNDWAPDNEAGGEREKKKVGKRVCPFLPFCGKSEMAKKENKNLFIILLPKDFLSF